MGEEDEKLVAPPDFQGPTESRHCTDLLMLILIIATWVTMTGIGIYSIAEGDFRKILFPLDYDGNICGTDFGPLDMTDFPNIVYVNNFLGGVCVKECPRVSDFEGSLNATADVGTLITYGGIFQADNAFLPADFIQVGNYSGAEDIRECTDNLCYPLGDPRLAFASPGVSMGFGYAYFAGDTIEAVRRCYYTTAAKEEILQQTTITGTAAAAEGIAFKEDITEFFSKLYADCFVARRYILGFGFGFSLGLSFLYVFLMRIPLLLTVIVWSSLFLANAIFYVGGYYGWNKANDWENMEPPPVDDNVIQATRIGAICLFVMGFVVTVLVCCLRRAIMISIACVKVAGKAINQMFAILLVPVVQAFGLILFMSVWLVYAVYLASLSDITTEDVPIDATGQLTIAVRRIMVNEFVTRAGWFLLFCLYWTSNFVVSVGDLVIALSAAKYYFTREKWKLGSWTVVISVWQTLFFHAGTCAFGALLIAIVQIIRTIIARAQKAAKKADNKIAQIILCCCQCFFWCLERCIKFINKHAYIQTALFSTAFCKSARQSFSLIARNAGRIGAITYVSGAILVVGRLFISSVTTVGAYYLINEDLSTELNSVGAPTLVVFLIAYWVSEFFMDIFDITITTVLHCFIADEEMFPENPFADKDLAKFIDDNGAEDE